MQPYDIGNQPTEKAADVAYELRDWLRSGVLSGKIDGYALGGLGRLLISGGETPEDALAFTVHALFYIRAAKMDPELWDFAEAFACRAIEALEAATSLKGSDFDWRE